MAKLAFEKEALEEKREKLKCLWLTRRAKLLCLKGKMATARASWIALSCAAEDRRERREAQLNVASPGRGPHYR